MDNIHTGENFLSRRLLGALIHSGTNKSSSLQIYNRESDALTQQSVFNVHAFEFIRDIVFFKCCIRQAEILGYYGLHV